MKKTFRLAKLAKYFKKSNIEKETEEISLFDDQRELLDRAESSFIFLYERNYFNFQWSTFNI